jgi:hypothetical protein
MLTAACPSCTILNAMMRPSCLTRSFMRSSMARRQACCKAGSAAMSSVERPFPCRVFPQSRGVSVQLVACATADARAQAGATAAQPAAEPVNRADTVEELELAATHAVLTQVRGNAVHNSPNLTSFAERWVRSVKPECLSKLILFGEAPLRRAERNHQGKQNGLLLPTPNSRTERYSNARAL